MKTILVLIVVGLSGVLFSSPLVADIDSGLIAYYPMNGNGNDDSGNGYDGIVYGGSFVADRLGNPNSAFKCSGGGQGSIRVTKDLPLANSSFSFAFWEKRDSKKDGNDFVFVHNQYGGTDAALHVGYRDTGVFWYDFHSTGFDNGDTSFDTEWHHWVGTYNMDTGVQSLYKNGEFVKSIEHPSPYLGHGELWIGYVSWGGFSGYIDELRFYNRVLSVAEIKELAGNGDTPQGKTTISLKEKVQEVYLNDLESIDDVWTFTASGKIPGDFSSFNNDTKIELMIDSFYSGDFFLSINDLISSTDFEHIVQPKVKTDMAKGKGNITYYCAYRYQKEKGGTAIKKYGTFTISWNNKALNFKVNLKFNKKDCVNWPAEDINEKPIPPVTPYELIPGNIEDETTIMVSFNDKYFEFNIPYSGICKKKDNEQAGEALWSYTVNGKYSK